MAIANLAACQSADWETAGDWAEKAYAVCVKRTTIMLPDDIDARLRREARRRGISIADVAREAIDRHLPSPAAPGRLSFFAVGEGSPPDASERVDELVNESVRRRDADR